MTKITHRAIAFACASFLAIGSVQAASKNSSRILQYVPADTPYVIASTEPMPKALADKLEPTIDEMMQIYQQVLRETLNTELAKLPEEEGDSGDRAKMQAVADEIIGLMSLEGLRGVGLERDSAFAFYGNGVMPVSRFELSDSDLFDAAIERIETKAETSLEVGEADGKSYKYFDLDGMHLVIATIDEQAIVTVVPASYDESQVSVALGIKKPSNSLRKSKTLAGVNKDYGYSPAMSGYFDTTRIASTLTGDLSGLDVDLFEALGGEELPELSNVCKAEFMEMAGIAPRMVFGYTELSTEKVDSSFVIELRDDIAAGMTAIPASVPGMGQDNGGLLSFGMGINLLEIRKFAAARLEAMAADPYECDKLAELQAGVAEAQEALNQPIPPIAYSFRGFVANIMNLDGFDFASGSPPENVDASLLIAIENAEALLMMASMMDPQIAGLNLQPDGTPVKLELAAIADLAEEAYAAMSSGALAIAMGDGAESRSASMLSADSLDPPPFISANVDAERYYQLIGEAMAAAPPARDVDGDEEQSEEMSAEMQEAMQEMMRLSGSIYDRMTADVHFTKRGIEIIGSATLQ